MREEKFKIDTLADLVFQGFTKDEEWNGWACPYFSFEEAQRITIAFNTLPNVKAWYEMTEDKFFFEFTDEKEEYNSIIANDKKLYPIGNSNWIWERV